MKRLFLCSLLLVCGVWTFAQMTPQQSASITRAARRASKGPHLLVLAQQGRIKQLRQEILHAYPADLQMQDSYGNNVLHVAKNKETFGFIWNLLDTESRERLLAQKNKAGETPLMSHIMYGHEDIFLQYFPRTRLYQQLKAVTAGLQEEGLNRHVVAIKKTDLIEQCSAGNQTMWQRAHALYQTGDTDAYARPHQTNMYAVQHMIAQVAPFLVRN